MLAGGYICAKGHAELPWMMVWCATGIVVGDVLPYLLGRIFGVRLLRLRWMRYMVTKQRLASFDRWFRRRGDWVILIARFIPGLRVVAFFTAGTMKMSLPRFLCLDGLGIVLMVPLLTWVGYRSAGVIEQAIATVKKVETGILWACAGAAVLAMAWLWLRRRRRNLARQSRPQEAFVQPQLPVQEVPPPPANTQTSIAPPPPDLPAGARPPNQAP